MKPLTRRERRLIALGILLLLVTGLIFGLVVPIISGFVERAAEREQLALQYARNQRLIAGMTSWRLQAEAQRRTAAAFAVIAPSTSAATDIVKEKLARVVGASGGELRAIQELPADPGWIKVRTNAQLSLTQLTDSLRHMQNQTPYMVVESLTVAADQAFATGRLAPMDVRLEIAVPYPVSAPR